jgi:hypothetical protein
MLVLRDGDDQPTVAAFAVALTDDVEAGSLPEALNALAHTLVVLTVSVLVMRKPCFPSDGDTLLAGRMSGASALLSVRARARVVRLQGKVKAVLGAGGLGCKSTAAVEGGAGADRACDKSAGSSTRDTTAAVATDTP